MQTASMSEKRRDGAWTGVSRNDVVAWGVPREGIVISVAPERINSISEKRREGAAAERIEGS